MARIQKPPTGRLVVSVIYSSVDAVADSLHALEKKFSRVQCETIELPASECEIYHEEMGQPLQRRFFSFEKPVQRDYLITAKQICTKLEASFSDRVDDFVFRTVNLDPGILTPENLVVAGYRPYNHRLYMTAGVYAELALIYARETFMRLPWTSPDYYHEEAISMFERTRATFDLLEEQAGSLAS